MVEALEDAELNTSSEQTQIYMYIGSNYSCETTVLNKQILTMNKRQRTNREG